MTPFHVGMKVVCVDDECGGKYVPKGRAFAIGLDGLRRGLIYTVRSVGVNPNSGRINIWLNEIYRPIRSGDVSECGYAHARFRPAHENRMDELRTLLAPSPSKAKTPDLVQP